MLRPTSGWVLPEPASCCVSAASRWTQATKACCCVLGAMPPTAAWLRIDGPVLLLLLLHRCAAAFGRW